MVYRVHRFFGALALAALLAACGGEPSPEVEQAEGGAAPAATAVVEAAATLPLASLPTVTPSADAPGAPAPAEAAPAEAAEPVDWTTHAYREGDYYIRGNPDAPVRLIDYSDFL